MIRFDLATAVIGIPVVTKIQSGQCSKDQRPHSSLPGLLNPPVVHYIRLYRYTGKAGDVIAVKATNDFHVEAVKIEVFDRTGKLLESGKAERYRRKPFIWKYKTTVANENFKGSILQATATDMPGSGCVMTARIGE